MVDTSKYYKDWDAQLTLGNQLEYHLENEKGDNIIFGFRIYNHGLAIEWIQRFYKISTQKSNYVTNLLVNDDKIENFGFEAKEPIFVFSKNYRCFDDGALSGFFLELKNVARPASDHVVVNTNPTFKFIKNEEMNTSGKDSEPHFDVTRQWNISDQDRTLTLPLNDSEKNNLKSGTTRIGFLSWIKLNGDYTKVISFDLNTVKIQKIEFVLPSA